MVHKVYNLTGSQGAESINVIYSSDNGRDLILWSMDIVGAYVGDTLLLDRPYYKSVPFKITELISISENKKVVLVRIKALEDHIGGYQGQLRLRFKRNSSTK